MLTRSELKDKMESFYNSHQDACKVLDAYNTVDPFQCYYGDDCNPDEYLGYAQRYLNADIEGATTLQRVVWSFHPNQFDEGWLTKDHCAQIAVLIDA